MTERMRRTAACLFLLVSLFADATELQAAEAGSGGVYSVVEIAFRGPPQTAKDAPARDIDFWVRFCHESGVLEHKMHGFWDGDGKGGTSGDVFKVRFCPTKPGRWTLAEVHANVKELKGQHQGGSITAAASKLPGFWLVDPYSAGQRWYMRSDGSHPYIIGNTHYSFLSGYQVGGRPSGNDIAADIAANANFFKKLRFGLCGDHYPNPSQKPFLDDDGRPTDWGDFSHRPNPRWFHQRTDVAVRTAYEYDLIADLILAGPDREESRSTLRAQHNQGDPTPYLRYIAARYGCFPNVWVCLCNEYGIRKPRYTPAECARFGRIIRGFLPYPTPLSVHPTSRALWDAAFDTLPPWHDHHIIQRKIRAIAAAADTPQSVWQNPQGRSSRLKPTVNDELSYEGTGDNHSEGDTIESHLGIFLGGGYGTTGHKTGPKTGHYFPGNFNPSEHKAADNLKWLREVIDAHVTFWKMAPDAGIFPGLDPAFRAMAWPGQEYVLGTDKAAKVTAELPPGMWTVKRFDVIVRKEATVSTNASGRFTFDTPDSRAVLFHFKKNREASKGGKPSQVSSTLLADPHGESQDITD